MSDTMTPVHVISSKYVPNWGAWEAYREVYCNTLDADPDGFILHFPNNSTADFYTRSAPSWHNLFLLGDGTKAPGGNTIGQFGEGLKNAALVAVRLGGNITIKTPEFTAHYELRDIKGAAAPVLYCVPAPPDATNPKEGCLVSLHVPGANLRTFESRFVSPSSIILDANTGRETCRIYCKGVFICEMPHGSLYNYNLNGISINRDRAIPDSWSVAQQFCATAAHLLTDADLRTLLLAPKNAPFETDCLNRSYHHTTEEFSKRVAAALTDEWGEKRCLLGTPSANEIAKNEGFTLVVVEKWVAQGFGIKTSDEVIPKHKTRRILKDSAPYAKHLRYLRSLFRGATREGSLLVTITEDDRPDIDADEDTGNIHVYLPRTTLDKHGIEYAVAICLSSLSRVSTGEDSAVAGISSTATIAARMLTRVKKFDTTPLSE